MKAQNHVVTVQAIAEHVLIVVMGLVMEMKLHGRVPRIVVLLTDAAMVPVVHLLVKMYTTVLKIVTLVVMVYVQVDMKHVINVYLIVDIVLCHHLQPVVI